MKMRRKAAALAAVLVGCGLGSAIRGVEPAAAPGLERLARAVPQDALAALYAAGYERLRTEMLASPPARSVQLPAFEPVRKRLLTGWQVLATEVEAFAGLKVEELLAGNSGPALLALLPGADLRNSLLPLLVLDVTPGEQAHRQLIERLLFRLNQMLPGVADLVTRLDYHGADVTALPADHGKERLCFAYQAGMFVAAAGENVLYKALDAMNGRNAMLSLAAAAGFQEACKAAGVAGASIAGYANLKRLIEHGERLNQNNNDIRGMRVLGLDAIGDVVAAEDISGAGVEDRVFVTVEDWRGALGALQTGGFSAAAIGSEFPADTVLYIVAGLEVRELLKAAADTLGRAGTPQQAAAVNGALLMLDTLAAAAGGFPSGEASAGICKAGGWLLSGALAAGFRGERQPLDALEALAASAPFLKPLAGGEVVGTAAGRLLISRPISNVPLTPLLLEKGNRLFLSFDPLLLRRLGELAPAESLAATAFFKEFTSTLAGEVLAAGYVDTQYVLGGVPALAGSLLVRSRQMVRRRTGIDVLDLPMPQELLADWPPMAFAVMRQSSGLYVKLHSPSGVTMPAGGALAAAALEQFRRRRPVEPGAPAAIVPDVAAAPAMDGVPNEPLYAQAAECSLEPDMGKVWLFTHGGYLYVAGKVPFSGGADSVAVRLSIWTSHQTGSACFWVRLAPGAVPATGYQSVAAMQWQPPVQYRQALETDKPTVGNYNFEASVPLAGFMLNPQTAPDVWRARIERLDKQGNVTAGWSAADAAGYLILRGLGGGLPAGLTEEMLLGRGRPLLPLPAVPPPPDEVLF